MLEQSTHRLGLRDGERPGRVSGPGNGDAGEPERQREDAGKQVLRPARFDEGLDRRLEEVVDQLPEPGDLDPPSDYGEHGESADRPAHPDPGLAAFGPVEVLARPGGGLAAEDEEHHPERVEAGQERARDADREQELPVPARGQRRGEDRVLGEEPGQRRDARQRERTDEERDVRPR